MVATGQFKPGAYYAAGSVPLMVAGVFLPDVFHPTAGMKAFVFFVCLAASLFLIIVGVIKEIGEDASPSSRPRRKIMAAWGMLVFGFGFIASMAVYFWPESDRSTQMTGAQKDHPVAPVLVPPEGNANVLARPAVNPEQPDPKLAGHYLLKRKLTPRQAQTLIDGLDNMSVVIKDFGAPGVNTEYGMLGHRRPVPLEDRKKQVISGKERFNTRVAALTKAIADLEDYHDEVSLMLNGSDGPLWTILYQQVIDRIDDYIRIVDRTIQENPPEQFLNRIMLPSEESLTSTSYKFNQWVLSVRMFRIENLRKEARDFL